MKKKVLRKKIIKMFILAFLLLTVDVPKVNANISGTKVIKSGDKEVSMTEQQIKNLDKDKYKICKDTIKELNSETDDWSALADRYAIDIDLNEKNQYEISIDSNALAPDLRAIKNDIKFKVKSVTFYDVITGSLKSVSINIVSENKKLQVGKKIKVKRPKTENKDSKGYGITEITLVPDGFNDPVLKAACDYNVGNYKIRLGSPKFTISVTSEDAGAASSVKEEIPSDIVLDKTPLVTGTINCNAPKTLDSFEQNFCDLKAKAGKTVSSVNQTMRCDNTKIAKTTGTVSAADYYQNKKYYFYEKTYTPTTTRYYKYHYGCKTVTDKDNPVVCKVNCQEVVVVEYGPPVAVKAGLCFEYKVKVTSKVVCRPMSQIPEPKSYEGYCTPTPSCASKTSTANKLTGTHRQGGPDEEFDQCVQECDGGKYTDKCSLSCYKKVYLGTISKTTGNELYDYSDDYYDYEDDDSVEVEQMKNASSSSKSVPKVGYYCNSNNQIFWYNGSNSKWKTKKITDFVSKPLKNRKNKHDYRDPRWYWDMSGLTISRYGCFKNTGIPAACSCKEKCLWVGCKGEVYINPSNPEKVKNKPTSSKIDFIVGKGISDYRENVKIYNEAKEACKRQSTCNTKTSTYTIEVKYNRNNTQGQVVTKQILANGSLKPRSENINKAKNILDNGGCYKYVRSDSNRDRWYMAEWTLQSTWINPKTGSTTNKETKGYIKKSGQVCLPLDANNVNQKWFNYYYTKKIGAKPSTVSSTTANTYSVYSDQFNEKCRKSTSSGGTTNCDWQVTDAMIKNFTPTYNIIAKATQFGYFDWNLNIECFYATNNNICSYNGNNTTVDESCISSGVGKKRIRSVDLGNLFPDSSGKQLKDPASTGRTPGFNWTQYSINESNNAVYKSNPIKYIQKVQDPKYRINLYTKQNLDYEVYLTKEKIREIKNTTAGSGFNYSAFNGNSTVLTSGATSSAVNYKSKLLRETLSGYTKVPGDGALICNNMKNYWTSECE